MRYDLTQLLERWSSGDETALDERQSRIVELRFFGGLTIEETAEVVGVSPATVKVEGSLATAWLLRELSR